MCLQMTAGDVAVAAAHGGAALPTADFRAMHAWFVLGLPAFLAVLVSFCLMVAKTALR